MGVRLKLVGNRGLYKDGKCVYLSNHRAWADFFIDMYITEVRSLTGEKITRRFQTLLKTIESM